MQKIDFFGGLSGNFLELVINVSINQNNYDISKPQFTKTGACHLKNFDTTYNRIAFSDHYSYTGSSFNDDDIVIRIVPTCQDVFIGITNSFLKSGDKVTDIENLEQYTMNKLTEKGASFKQTLISEYGKRTNYPRSTIRNYFYSMLFYKEYGLDMFTDFKFISRQIFPQDLYFYGIKK